MRRGAAPCAALSNLERKVIYLSDKKVNRLIKPASLGDTPQKKQDQPLSAAAGDAAFVGKISDPIEKPAKRPRRKAAEKPEAAKQEKKPEKGKKAAKPAAQEPPKKETRTKRAPRAAQGGTAREKQPARAPLASEQPAAQTKGRRRSAKQKPSVKVYFLGGLNEIGKNFTLFECGEDMVIVDCGLAFPDEEMPGIDAVIPDFSFVEKNMDRIRGVVITHGHEDHIGSLPYLLKKIRVPVYGTALTIALIENKLKEHNLGHVRLHVTPAGSHIHLGCFDVELIHVNHSISDAVGLALHTPAGVIVHTGDFKIDFTPTQGGMIDLARFAKLGEEGVLMLMADSTNAERPGYTQTEQKVNATFESMFARADANHKRLIIATFASNISRVQQIINCAAQYGRKVALSGRSMVNVMTIASGLGYLDVPDGLLIDLNMISRYPKDQIVLITTGSQGEPMSALTRMAFDDHRQVAVGEDDMIIISARPIPGNEKTVGTVVDELLKRGCDVVYESMYEVHVSGHACQEELKIIQALTKPKYFIPVHGEQKHLRKHAGVAMSMGVPPENIFIGDIGNAVEVNEAFIRRLPDVPAGAVMVDGLGVGDVGSIVLRDRKHLAEDGLIIAVCTIDSASGEVVSGPDIVSRGFVYVRESEGLMEEARRLVGRTISQCMEENVREWSAIKIRVRDSLSRLLYSRTKRSPMILPIIMEV